MVALRDETATFSPILTPGISVCGFRSKLWTVKILVLIKTSTVTAQTYLLVPYVFMVNTVRIGVFREL